MESKDDKSPAALPSKNQKLKPDASELKSRENQTNLHSYQNVSYSWTPSTETYITFSLKAVFCFWNLAGQIEISSTSLSLSCTHCFLKRNGSTSSRIPQNHDHIVAKYPA